MSGRPIKPNKCKVNHLNFINIKSPIYSYVLGLLWTDGHVSKKTNTIIFTSTIPDGDYFKNYFLKTGKWAIYYYSYNNGWKTRVTIQTTNKYLKDFLKSYDFNNKSNGFNSIYLYIPYKEHFLRGIIDGDGTIVFNEKTGNYHISICSNIEQDWNCFQQILDSKNIKYKILRKQTSNGSYSKLFVYGKSRVEKLGGIIYATYDKDHIGLPRKYEKYKLIKNKCNKWIMSDAQ